MEGIIERITIADEQYEASATLIDGAVRFPTAHKVDTGGRWHGSTRCGTIWETAVLRRKLERLLGLAGAVAP